MQRKRASHLREAEVVADDQADPAERGVEDLQLVPGRDETVDTQERQVGLAVGADQAVGADEDRRVVQRVALALDQPGDRVDAEPPALALEGLGRRAGDLLRVGERLLGTVEHVAGDRALREDRQLGALSGGLLEPPEAGVEVPLLLGELRLQLGHGDPHLDASLIV